MRKKVVPVEEAYSIAQSYGADGEINEHPFWNKRLPWLASVPVCTGYHDFKRDKVTAYVYCFTCGISCGLV